MAAVASLEVGLENLALGNQAESSGVKERKEKLRNEIWSRLTAGNCLRPYPPSCFGKIPYFRGCDFATARLVKLREFKRAQVVKVNPSLAQMSIRLEVLKANKMLVVPSPDLVPRLEKDKNSDVFCHLLDGRKILEKKKAMTKNGAATYGSPLLVDWSDVGKVDFLVVGSVAVAKNGRRLGKGLGFAELEWGILYELGVVDQSTVVVTTVHEQQIVDNIVDQVDHDLPVDIIVTPTRIVNVRPRPAKPTCGVLWDQIDEEKMAKLAVLKHLKDKVEK